MPFQKKRKKRKKKKMSLDSEGKCAVCKGRQAPTGQDGAGEIIWPDSVFGTEGTGWLRTQLSGGLLLGVLQERAAVHSYSGG